MKLTSAIANKIIKKLHDENANFHHQNHVLKSFAGWLGLNRYLWNSSTTVSTFTS